MAQCTTLATKAEVEELKKLINKKLDKSEEERIIQASVGIAVPSAIAGAVGQLSPDIKSALSKAGQALGKATTNAGKILSNGGKIASNFGKITGLLASVAGILLQLGVLTLVTKHEFVDLPGIRQSITNQQREIEANFRLILRNREIAVENKRKIAINEKNIAENRKVITFNTAQILRNEAIINQNKIRIKKNESQIITNALEITRVEREYKQDIKNTEERLRNEYETLVADIQADLQRQLDNAQAEFDQKIKKLEFDFGLSQVIQDRKLLEADATIDGLRRSNQGVRKDVENLIRTKAGKPELEVIRRRVANNERTIGNATSVTRRVGGTSTQTQEKVQNLEQEQSTIKDKVDKLVAQVGVAGVDQKQLDRLRRDVSDDFNKALVTAGLTTAFTNNVNTNLPTNARLVSATQQGICNSAAPGGCLNDKIRLPLGDKLDSIINGLGASASGANLLLNRQILTRVTDIQNVVNSSTNGLAAINNFMRNSWASTVIDKTLNAANFALSLHNAMMLSNNVATTIFETLDIAFELVGIEVKNAEGDVIGVTDFMKSKLKTILESVIGAETYAELRLKLTVANRIYQAGMNILDNVTDLFDTAMEIDQHTGENLGRIGNALRESGTINFGAYSEMLEDLSDMRSRSNWMNRLEQAQEASDNIYAIADNIRNLKEIGTELTENRQELKDSIAAIQTEKDTEEETVITTIEDSPEPTEEDETRG